MTTKRAKISGQPTPKPVLLAIEVIREYLEEGGWEQVIINVGGGASFRLTDIYEDWHGDNLVEKGTRQ